MHKQSIQYDLNIGWVSSKAVCSCLLKLLCLHIFVKAIRNKWISNLIDTDQQTLNNKVI